MTVSFGRESDCKQDYRPSRSRVYGNLYSAAKKQRVEQLSQLHGVATGLDLPLSRDACSKSKPNHWDDGLTMVPS